MQEQVKAQTLEMTKLKDTNKSLSETNNDLVKANSKLYASVITSKEVIKPNKKLEEDSTVNYKDLQDKAVKVIVSKANRDKLQERKLTAEINEELKTIKEED
jgi:hypothetical protein